MSVEDLLGLGRGAEKLLDLIGKACGVLYRPHAIRREADAEAYKLQVIEAAKAKATVTANAIVGQAGTSEGLTDAATINLLQRAETKTLSRQLQEQQNLERVIAFALQNVGPDASPDPVDPDWLNTILRYAEHAHSGRMQELWGKVLAGETELPGSYSRKALDTLQGMTQLEANVFQDACALASSKKGARHKSIVYGCSPMAGIFAFLSVSSIEINLAVHGMSYSGILLLRSIGLLQPEPLISGRSRRHEEWTLECNGVGLNLIARRAHIALDVHSFTPVGNELSHLITPSPSRAYIEELKYVLRWGFNVTESDATTGSDHISTGSR